MVSRAAAAVLLCVAGVLGAVGALSVSAPTLTVEVDVATGGVAYCLDGVRSFLPGPTVLRNNATWYMSSLDGAPAGARLLTKTAGPLTRNGTDAIGPYTETYVEWATDTSGTAQTRIRYVTGARQYTGTNSVGMFQYFPDGLVPGNREGKLDEIVSSYGTINASTGTVGGIWYEGTQLQLTRTFVWPAGERLPSSLGGDGGVPLVLYETAPKASVVIGPLDHFFTTTQGRSDVLGGQLAFGFQGTTTAVPPGTQHGVLITAGGAVADTFLEWGDALLEFSGNKRRSMKWTESGDESLKYLSYYTDNGAYYYYNTEKADSPATGYVTTMEMLLKRFKETALPVKSVQYDSWWYFKAAGGGLLRWEPQPSIFPDWWTPPGGLPLVLHNRYFDLECDYVKSGNYSWAMGKTMAVPIDKSLFVDIMGKAQSKWGMVTYEQDWLVTQYQGCDLLQQTPLLGKQWLSAMNDAAEDLNVTVQYCMALPRHILQSAAMERVTQARASHDYHQSRDDQWNTPELNAMLYWAVGLLPFKDDFWSESIQPGNKWKDKGVEQNPELQTLVSALLAGPVGPSDRFNQTNTSRIMQTCRADGLLLKPERPAYLIQESLDYAMRSNSQPPHIWHTPMQARGSTTTSHLVLNVNATVPFTVALDQLTSGSAPPGDVFAREYYTHREQRLDAAGPGLQLNPPKPVFPCVAGPGHCYAFELWTLTPVDGPGTLFLLGEPNKFVGVSPQRFSQQASTGAALSVTVSGSPGEAVLVDVWDKATGKTTTTTCSIGASGSAVLTCDPSCRCA